MWSRDAWTIISKNIAANATAYTDNTVMVGITYYYRILAHNSAGDSAFSNTDYDSTALVSAAQIPTATTFGMPFGEELKGDLNKLTIDTCPNDYPKLRFNDGHPTNEWYVATAFNKNTWVNSQCVSQGLYAPHHDFHPGEDWNSTQGSGAWPSGDGRAPLYAIGNGIVIFNSGECSSTGADAVNQCNNKSWKGGFGNTLIIAHQTVSSEYVLSFYGHMADPSPLVEGTSVNQGDPIGNIGSTGTGAYHLHFEIRRAGMLVINPRTGRLALVEKPGFWPETYYPEDAPQQEFISTNYYAPSEFLKAHQTTNVVGTNATLDGEPWSGVIDYYIVGPNIELFCPSGCQCESSRG